MVQSLRAVLVFALVTCVRSAYKNRHSFSVLGTNPFTKQHAGLSKAGLGQRGVLRQGVVSSNPPTRSGPSTCEPYSCKYYSADGLCSKTDIKNFMRVNTDPERNSPTSPCGNGCHCYVPGSCPNEEFKSKHVCDGCETSEEVLNFMQVTIGRCSAYSSYDVFVEPHVIICAVNSFDCEAACTYSNVKYWKCFADGFGYWHSCNLVSSNCEVHTNLLTAQIFKDGIECTS